MTAIDIDTAIGAHLTWGEMALLNISLGKEEQCDKNDNGSDKSKTDFQSFKLTNYSNNKQINEA